MTRLLEGVAFALVLFVGSCCALSWSFGGSADPRCVYHATGYEPVFHYSGGNKPPEVSCQYRAPHTGEPS